jgi:biopolymer transport protein ExbB/TolQ
MLGILAQTIGIYQALVAIQQMGNVSPAIIFGGFKVSMIAPMYGLIIFVITLIIRLVLPFFTSQQEDWSDQTNS